MKTAAVILALLMALSLRAEQENLEMAEQLYGEWQTWRQGYDIVVTFTRSHTIYVKFYMKGKFVKEYSGLYQVHDGLELHLFSETLLHQSLNELWSGPIKIEENGVQMRLKNDDFIRNHRYAHAPGIND